MMLDKSYFWIPQYMPKDEGDAKFPIWKDLPLPVMACVGGKKENTATGLIGVASFMKSKLGFTSAVEFKSTPEFDAGNCRGDKFDYPIPNLWWLNYMLSVKKYPARPEIDKRVAALSEAMCYNGICIVDPDDVSLCWYRAIADMADSAPPKGCPFPIFPFEAGVHGVEIARLNFADYTVSQLDEAREYCETNDRTDVLEILNMATAETEYVVLVHEHKDTGDVTRIALFVGLNSCGGLKCDRALKTDILVFKPPPCEIFGKIGGSSNTRASSPA